MQKNFKVNFYINFLFIILIKDQNLTRIEAEKANISKNNWILQKVKIYNSKEKDAITHEKLDFYSIFNWVKLNPLTKT